LYALDNKGSLQYNIYPKMPYQIKTDITNDFLKIAEKYSKNEKEKRGVELARRILIGNDYTTETISEFNKIAYKQYKPQGYEILSELSLGVFDPDKIRNKIENYITNNISLQLYSYGKKINSIERRCIDSLIRLMKRFKPYELETRRKYFAYVSEDENEILEVLDSLKTCRAGDRMTAKKWAIDEGTFFIIIKDIQTDNPIGYTRLFLYKKNKRESFLAIDTLEVPRKITDVYGNKMYANNLTEHLAKSYEDVIKAEGVASILLTMDLNVDFLVGEEGRVKYHLRQAMSDKKITIRGQKIGKLMNPGEYYSYPDIISKETMRDTRSYLLFLNWKKYMTSL